MPNTRLLKTTLMAASAAIALTAVPSWADDAWSDGDGAVADGTSYSDAITISYGDNFAGITTDNAATITQSGESGSYTFSGSDSEGYQGSWVIYGGTDTNAYTFSSTISGTGFLGVAVKVGNQSTTIDMTGANAENFSGQFMALNVWDRSYTVKLGGSSWANVEYVFGGVSREWWDPSGTLDASASNATSGDFLALAGDGNTDSSYEDATLELSSDTSLAGVSGTSATFADGGITFSTREAITATSADTTLTITGTGAYEFYGTVGSSDVVLDIAKTGTGSQTFGGMNYLGNISVSDGKLVLGTLSVTAADTTISGAGEVSITSVDIGAGSTSRTLSIGTDETAATVTAGSITVNGTTTIAIASGSTLAVEGTLDDHSGYDTSISGNGTLTADVLDFTGSGHATISVANATVGSIVNENGSGNSRTITIAEGSTVNAGLFSRTSGILTLAVNGTLNVAKNDETGATGIVAIGTSDSGGNIGATQYISGSGTLNAYGISYNSGSNENANVEVSVANLNVGEGGITNNGASNFEFTGDTGTTVGLYNATDVTISTSMWLNSSAGTTFNTEAGQTMTLTGAITGSKGLAKTGAGTLTLSGENGYSGGTTIAAGTVVAENTAAFGTGSVTVGSDATLQIDIAVSTGAITFSDGAVLVIGSDLLASAVVESDADAEVATVADTEAVAVISAESIVFGTDTLSDGDVSSIVNEYVSSDITSAYDLTWTFSNGALSVSATAATPEPSMFGLLAGLGALGFVATRRRRNRKA
ncbi:MAG: autotransporter-associated beta strand repeat-containing protein [Opitutae bacterium]|nr:autotransporter-associated beta strand repeat-containing protein [Opitutae bacterium]MCD8299053.1 autotransporter-associated beta strand repeat-containing protein [Opitutae bacterium]